MNKPISLVTTRQINLTYVLAGCLLNSFDDLQGLLKLSASELNHENKYLLNELIRLCSRYEHLYNRLRNISVTTLSEQGMALHNDAIDKYYSLLMTLVTKIGSDDKADLRAYALMKNLSKYTTQISFPKKEGLIDRVAWQDTINKVEDENISDEYLNGLLGI